MSIISKADKAASVAVKLPAKKKGKKEVEIAGLEDFVVIDSLIKTLEAVKATFEEPVKDRAKAEFLTADGGKRPDSFTGLDGIAEASVQLRKRSSRSALSDEEAALLTAKHVPFDIVDDVPEAYAINPKYLTDSALLARIEKVKGLPDDFVVKQVAQTRRVVSDETVDTVFARGLATELVDVVTTLAIRGKLNSTDPKKTLALVTKLLKN
jgi:hypothetical protein